MWCSLVRKNKGSFWRLLLCERSEGWQYFSLKFTNYFSSSTGRLVYYICSLTLTDSLILRRKNAIVTLRTYDVATVGLFHSPSKIQ